MQYALPHEKPQNYNSKKSRKDKKDKKIVNDTAKVNRRPEINIGKVNKDQRTMVQLSMTNHQLSKNQNNYQIKYAQLPEVHARIY